MINVPKHRSCSYIGNLHSWFTYSFNVKQLRHNITKSCCAGENTVKVEHLISILYPKLCVARLTKHSEHFVLLAGFIKTCRVRVPLPLAASLLFVADYTQLRTCAHPATKSVQMHYCRSALQTDSTAQTIPAVRDEHGSILSGDILMSLTVNAYSS